MRSGPSDNVTLELVERGVELVSHSTHSGGVHRTPSLRYAQIGCTLTFGIVGGLYQRVPKYLGRARRSTPLPLVFENGCTLSNNTKTVPFLQAASHASTATVLNCGQHVLPELHNAGAPSLHAHGLREALASTLHATAHNCN